MRRSNVCSISYRQAFNKVLTLLEANIKLFVHNLQCKQILLAGSGDNGYGSFLRQHVPSTGKSEKITLIESLPFALELKLVSDRFETIKFDLFRDEKIDVKRNPSYSNVTAHHGRTVSAADSEQNMSTSPTHVGFLGAPSGLDQPASMNGASSNIPFQLPGDQVIYINRYEQRVDKPILNVDDRIIYRLKGYKPRLCNNHYLRRDCAWGSNCSYNHDMELSPVELENLRVMSRQTPCDKGTACKEPACVYGHQCRFGEKCEISKCKFPDELHMVDTNSATPLTVNW